MFEKDSSCSCTLPNNKSELSDAPFLKWKQTGNSSEAEMEEMVDYIISHYEE